MYNLNKLNGLIVERYKTKRNFAKDMGLSERTVYLKLQGKIEFKPSEIEMACSLLGIPDSKIPIYFFTKKVQKN